MKMKFFGIVALACLLVVFCNCGGSVGNGGYDDGSVKLSEREAYRYDMALREVESLDKMCEEVIAAPTQENIALLLVKAKGVKYSYNDNGMNVATLEHCDSLKARMEECQQRALGIAESFLISTGDIKVVNIEDKLFTENAYYPIYLKKGEKLFYNIESSKVITAKLYNSDTEELLKSFKKSEITDSFTVRNTGIYLMEVAPQGKQYVSVVMSYRPVKAEDIYSRPTIYTEQVECKKGDIGAKGVPGVIMRKCFEEPRKFTLRGQLKAAFSGNAKALVAVPLPAGTTDLLYTMRIATSESNRSEDGQFHDNLSRSYSRVKFLGLPLYEKTSSNGLLNTLLDDNRPIRDEDAYCSMYVFRKQAAAKQFQDGTKPVSQLAYDVDYSTVGTQSCNGRIPTNGAKTIYLGFENERVRYTNYLWVEVEAVVPNTVYYTTKYSIR